MAQSSGCLLGRGQLSVLEANGTLPRDRLQNETLRRAPRQISSPEDSTRMPIFPVITCEPAGLREPLLFNWHQERLGCFNEGCARARRQQPTLGVARKGICGETLYPEPESPARFRNNRSLSVWRNVHRRWRSRT